VGAWRIAANVGEIAISGNQDSALGSRECHDLLIGSTFKPDFPDMDCVMP